MFYLSAGKGRLLALPLRFFVLLYSGLELLHGVLKVRQYILLLRLNLEDHKSLLMNKQINNYFRAKIA